MISVDTNIIVRLLTRDDESQYRRAYRLLRKEQVFVPDTVVLETEWVLRYAYEFAPDEICSALSRLFGLNNVHTANPVVIHQAIEWHRQGLEFSDALHLSGSQHCAQLLTFDKGFAKSTLEHSSCRVSLA